jgi:hypothetical protein
VCTVNLVSESGGSGDCIADTPVTIQINKIDFRARIDNSFGGELVRERVV